ncbi:MAG: precorrin-2 C(20)-methyltransferase [Alteromonadaceae bacterium]|nr:MAG: precorrin-2 C(20)-methyltransferase [Alteromonadaceae bacterium]
MTAQFIGVGVGPGDPELITLKAARLIQQADVISYLCNQDGRSQAKHIARLALADTGGTQEEIPIVMPMREDRTIANQRYDQGAASIQAAINAGKTVVFLCEGDPLFFGSFAYLLERLQDSCPCEVVPGISSVHAAASVLQAPLTMQKESFAVISGRHDDDVLDKTLNLHDSVVIMKAGLSRQRILQALTRTQRTGDASYLEYIGRDQQIIEPDVSKLKDEAGPYFSLFVITRKDRERL